MAFQRAGRMIGAAVLVLALIGCVDATMDIRVKSDTEAQAIMTQTISAQFYPMLKATKSSDSSLGADGFCTAQEGGVLVENADGSATCTISKQGKFAELSFDRGREPIAFTSPGPGLVRVALSTAQLSEGLNDAARSSAGAAGANGDAQMKQAMAAYFAGHFLTIRVAGGEITESDMTIAADRQSAEEKLPLDQLVTGTAKLPAELYAVVKVP